MTDNNKNINLDNSLNDNINGNSLNDNINENSLNDNINENSLNNENTPKEMTTLEKILNVINMLRPYINADGGDIEFIKYEDKYVYVKFHGACASCGSIDYTIKDVLFNAIKDDVPEVEGIINVAI